MSSKILSHAETGLRDATITKRDARNPKLAASSRVNVPPLFLTEERSNSLLRHGGHAIRQFFWGSHETGIRGGYWKVACIANTPTQIGIIVVNVYKNNRAIRELASKRGSRVFIQRQFFESSTCW